MSDPQVDIHFPADIVETIRDCPFENLVGAWEDVVNFYGKAGQRELCRIDRFYLLTHVLGRVDAFDPWLYARCREVEANPDGHLDLWAREHYKDLAVDTPILSPGNGWVAHGELLPGDFVFGSDGRATRVVAVTEHFTDSETWRITFDDGEQIVCGGGHLWQVERRTRKRAARRDGDDREVSVMKTAEMARHGCEPDNRLAVRVAPPLQQPDEMLLIDPYVLGCWLGDGETAGGRITCQDAEVWDRLASSYKLSHNHVPTRNVRTSTLYGLREELRAYGVLGDKHIPTVYFGASVTQRRALLQGLMDTDGHCNVRGTAYLNLKCERLARDALHLAQTLGLKPGWSEYEADHGTVYQVRFQAYKVDAPFHLSRKLARCKDGERVARRFITRIERIPTVRTNCIQVEADDGIYLAGRNLIPTHNSTIITFTGAIQEIIRDPEITICIFSHTKGIAKKFFVQVKEELERNLRLQDIFPDIFWADTRKAPRWSEEKGLVVKRKSNSKEATLEAHGLVDGQPTSAHYRLRIYDDVVTRESVSTPDQIAKTTDAWALSDNLGARQENGGTGRAWHIGTRYHFADSYNEIMKRGVCKVRIYPATDTGLPDGNPVFLSREVWEEKKKTQGPATIACQMLQNPAAGNEAMFQRDHLRFIDIRPNTLNVYIMCDPASSKKKGSDRTAMPVIAVDAQRNKYLIDGYHHKMNLQERWAALSGLRRFWMRQPGVQAVHVGYERYGMLSDLEYFEERMRLANDSFEIRELSWTKDGQDSKFDRIQRLYPDFSYGRFYLIESNDSETANQKRMRESGQQYRVLKPVRRRDHEGNVYALNQGFLDEYLTYPFSIHDDMLDACSRIYDMEYQPPIIIDERMLEPEVFEDGI